MRISCKKLLEYTFYLHFLIEIFPFMESDNEEDNDLITHLEMNLINPRVLFVKLMKVV